MGQTKTGDFMARPGVMFYFDTRPCLKRLSNEDKGRLFEAILDFGEYGVIPDFDGTLGVAWDFIQPKIDRDCKRYESIVEKRTQAAKARWAKEGRSSDANECTCISDMPNTDTNSTTSSTPTSKSKANTAVGGLGEEKNRSPYLDPDSPEAKRYAAIELLRNYPAGGGMNHG